MDNEKQQSKLEDIRQHNLTQVEPQRTSILDAAEKLFVKKGLENTNMTDIAAQAGITRMSLYRYFPDRHPIAFEIAIRMLRKVVDVSGFDTQAVTIEIVQSVVLRMIDRFYDLRDAYRYLGMFDHLYGDRYPSEDLALWYKRQMFSLGFANLVDLDSKFGDHRNHYFMLVNSTMSFLQKLATRGEIMSEEQGINLDEQLAYFTKMVHLFVADFKTETLSK
jgi:AcrR family transcriptional regulator